MPSTSTADTGGPVKKRRSFFSSQLSLPTVHPTPSSSRPSNVPRAQVLAALSAPEEVVQTAPRPRREAKIKAVETLSTPKPDEPSGSRRSARQPPPPKSNPESQTRSLRQRSVKELKEPDSGASTPLLRSPSHTNASKRKSSRQVPVPISNKGKEKASTKDENAQSVNERLSLMMMQSMRATIGGREKPYERVPVLQRSRKQAKRVRRNVLPPLKRRSALTSLSARQKAKQKAKEDEEESEEEVTDDEPEVTPKKAQPTKKFMNSGFYCQDANAQSPYKLVNKVLGQGYSRKGKSKNLLPNAKKGGMSFPPLPYDHGYDHFFGKEHDFLLPYDIHKEATNGALNDKKKPAPYQKIRGNVFPERSRIILEKAVCKCDPESGCGDTCINRIMSYICGRDCPCGDRCTNKSLTKRQMAETKVKYTSDRGFGLFAMQDIGEGDFVIDYRGEVISLELFHDRLDSEYAGQKNFYALAYDQDEVIDAGMRGNDARFINHGCDPNVEVRKLQTLGDGFEEFEIGMWAKRDIKQGEELFYNYNFDWFGEAKDSMTTQCRCGSANCIGYLGKKNDRSAALEAESKKAAEAAREAAKTKRGKKAARKLAKKSNAKSIRVADKANKVTATSTAIADIVPPASDADKVEETDTGGSAMDPVVEMEQEEEEGEDEQDGDWIDVTMDMEQEESAAEASPERDQLDEDPTPSTPAIKEETATIQSSTEPRSSHTNKVTRQSPRTRSPVPPSAPVPRSSLIFPTSPEVSERSPSRSQRATSQEQSPIPFTVPPPSDVTFASTGQTTSRLPTSRADQPSIEPNASPSERSSINADGWGSSSNISDAQAVDDAAAAKRKSGWANWLRKIASEKQRTLEEWHEERMKRRRGIAWMNMMIAEFGVAPSPSPVSTQTYSDGRKPAGSVGSFANTLAAQGHGPGPAGVRNLGGPKNMYRSDNWKKTKEEQMRYSSMRPGSMTPGPQTPSKAGPSIQPGSVPAESSRHILNPEGPASVPNKRPAEQSLFEADLMKRARQQEPPRKGVPRSRKLLAVRTVPPDFSNMPPPSRHLTSYPQTMVPIPTPTRRDAAVQGQSRAQTRGQNHDDIPTHEQAHPPSHGPARGPTQSPTQAPTLVPAQTPQPVQGFGHQAGSAWRGMHPPAVYHGPPQKSNRPVITGWAPPPALPAPTVNSQDRPTPGSSTRIQPPPGYVNPRRLERDFTAPVHPVGNQPKTTSRQSFWKVAEIPPFRGTNNQARPMAPSVGVSSHSAIPGTQPSPAQTAPRSDKSNKILEPASYPQSSESTSAPDHSGRSDTTAAPVVPSLSPAHSVQAQPESSRPQTPSTASSLRDSSPSRSSPYSAREARKRESIKKRNGAPMGWAYTYEPVTATRMGQDIIEDLPRSARRARQSTQSSVKVEPVHE